MAAVFDTGRCRDAECGAPIIWATTRAGKAQPVDAEPADGGTILLTHAPDGLSVRSEVVNPAAPPLTGWPEPLRKPHHETCPGAARWRSKKPKGTP